MQDDDLTAVRGRERSDVVEPTGDLAVDEALTRLTEVSELGLREQLAVFDAVHAALQDRLADAEG
ncbi:MAG TPA: hypothetical protein VGC57_11045 [Cellulomonas sp.]